MYVLMIIVCSICSRYNRNISLRFDCVTFPICKKLILCGIWPFLEPYFLFLFFFNVLLPFLFSHVSATVDHAVYHIQRDEGEIQQSSLAWCCFQVWFAASFPSKQPSRWYGKIQKLWTWGSHPSFGQKWIWSSRGWLDILAAQHCHCRR